MALHHATTPLDDDTDATLAPDPLLTDIEALNRKHAFVMIGGKAMVMNFEHDPNQGETLTFSSQADFRARYANRSTLVLCEDGTRLAPLAEQWWSHPQRREYAGLVFMPGNPQELATAHGRPYYNLFRGWPVQPVPGDCSLFWAHLKDIICAGKFIQTISFRNACVSCRDRRIAKNPFRIAGFVAKILKFAIEARHFDGCFRR